MVNLNTSALAYWADDLRARSAALQAE